MRQIAKWKSKPMVIVLDIITISRYLLQMVVTIAGNNNLMILWKFSLCWLRSSDLERGQKPSSAGTTKSVTWQSDSVTGCCRKSESKIAVACLLTTTTTGNGNCWDFFPKTIVPARETLDFLKKLLFIQETVILFVLFSGKVQFQRKSAKKLTLLLKLLNLEQDPYFSKKSINTWRNNYK